ncbi:MAG: MiaB/RimO family radical SAM methylthiotransferase, partial [Magnetococcales bacterium]|nr:MiaB/RimO family radical SAM methylthiotransferase [Magnetococcales bacterium]
MNNPVVKRMSLFNMGCRVNWTEMEQLRQQGLEQGYQPVGQDEAADLVVINTCSVTGESERQARQLIRRVVRENPGAKVVVTGCYAERDPATLSAMAGVDRVVGNQEKSSLLKWIEPGSRSSLESCPPLVQAGVERARVFLQVQNGCSQRCTFCVIPPLRGKSRSLPLDEALQQAQHHVASGIREVVLSGINLGEYGVDLLPPRTLAHLVEQVSQIVGLERLRLSSIHPADLTDELLAWFANSPRLCNHLHLSVQSGDSLILKRMGRHYGREYLCQRLACLRSLRPDMVLGGDFIVGFPTESEEAFRNTL